MAAHANALPTMLPPSMTRVTSLLWMRWAPPTMNCVRLLTTVAGCGNAAVTIDGGLLAPTE